VPQNQVVVFVTASSAEEADVIARAAVEERLAACANIVPSVSSVFRWKGKIEREAEVLIILKTRRGVLERLVARVQDLHSYEVPEVIALPIVGGSEEYLDWLREQTEPVGRPAARERRGPFGPGF